MDDGGEYGRGCFEVEVRTGANVVIAGLRESSDLVGKGKMFVKDEAKIASKFGGAE